MKPYVILSFLICALSTARAQYHLDQLSDTVKIHLKEGWKCWNETEESCIPYYEQFLESVKQNNECVPCAETELARIYNWEGFFEKSMQHAQNVLKGAQKYSGQLRDELELDAYNTIGQNHLELGNPQQAIAFFLKSQQIIDKLGKKEYSAIIKVNIGSVYATMNDCKQAISYNKQALTELTELGNNRTAQVAKNIAGEYINCGQADSAKIWAFKTLELSKAQQNSQFEIAAYAYLAELYKEALPDSALYYISKAEQFKTSDNITLENGRMYITKGNILSNRGKYTAANSSFIKAQELLKPLHATQDLLLLYKQWGVAANRHGDYKTASENFHSFIVLNDSVNSENAQKTVRELHTKYETEKKERQIIQQQLEIQQQKSKTQTAVFTGLILLILALAIFILVSRNHRARLRQIRQEKENAILNAFIKGEERERNRISYELHDGVASMISAAKMTLDTIPHLPAAQQKGQMEKVAAILSDTHADVRHIAHNLLPATLEQEGLVKATRQFVAEINQSDLIEISVSDNSSNARQLPQQLQLMLFRIIQELVNNIIKHSQAQHASIVFSQNKNGLQLEITDDGIGYSGKDNGNSQGIYSISQRLKSIGGNFEIVKRSSQGTQAIVELKLT